MDQRICNFSREHSPQHTSNDEKISWRSFSLGVALVMASIMPGVGYEHEFAVSGKGIPYQMEYLLAGMSVVFNNKN